MTRYKLEEKNVDRTVFINNSGASTVLTIWEKALDTHKKAFETAHASVIFSFSNGKFTVLTETTLLLKLYNEIKDNNIIKASTKKQQPLEIIKSGF